MPSDKGIKNLIGADVALAVLLAAFMLAILAMGTMTGEMVYALPGIALFTALYFIHGKCKKIVYIIAAVVIGGALAAAFFMYSEDITSGLKLLGNNIFNNGEKAQNYIYKKYDIEIYGYDLQVAAHMGIAWVSGVIGLIASIPPVEMRKVLCLDIVLLTMVLFAFMGMIPNLVAVGLMMGAAIFIAAGERLKAVWPVLLSGLLVCGLMFAVNPGEIKSVSKVDEKIRDALSADNVRLKGMSDSDTKQKDGSGSQNKNKNKNNNKKNNDNPDSPFIKPGRALIVILLILLFGTILFVPAVIIDKLKKKRMANRLNIDSEDDRQAIVAMFPYAMKWLNEYGVSGGNKPFSTMKGMVARETTPEYLALFSNMLGLWEKAAFSEETIKTGSRERMNDFLGETIKMTKKKIGIKGIMRVKYRLAL